MKDISEGYNSTRNSIEEINSIRSKKNLTIRRKRDAIKRIFRWCNKHHDETIANSITDPRVSRLTDTTNFINSIYKIENKTKLQRFEIFLRKNEISSNNIHKNTKTISCKSINLKHSINKKIALFTNNKNFLHEKGLFKSELYLPVNKTLKSDMFIHKFKIKIDATKINTIESCKENLGGYFDNTSFQSNISQSNIKGILKDHNGFLTDGEVQLYDKIELLNELNGDGFLKCPEGSLNSSPLFNKGTIIMPALNSLEFLEKERYASLNIDMNQFKMVSPLIIQEEECAFEQEKTPININSQDTEVKDMNSAETLNDCLEFTNSNIDDNVKCLVVPTFREKQWPTLNDYIRGHDEGIFSQINIINQANCVTSQSKQLLNDSKIRFEPSDFRNLSFFTEEIVNNKNTCSESNDESKFYTISNDTNDIKTVTDSIKSIGFETNDRFSKLKFNLLSEVFYYNDTTASKINNKLSLIDFAKAGLHDVKDFSNKNFDGNSISEPSCKYYHTPLTTYDSCLLLVNLSKMAEFGKATADLNHEKSLNDVFYNKNLKLSGGFNMRKLLFENDYKYSGKNKVNIEFIEQESVVAALGGFLSDDESLKSNDLVFSCTKDLNSSAKKDSEPDITIFSDMSRAANIKPILKQRHNKNELIESKIADIESSEQIDLFFNKFDAKEEMRLKMEPKLTQIRALQLKKFYSKDFYPNMQEDEEFLRSVRATQNKIGFSIFNE